MNNGEMITNSKDFHRAMFQLWTDTVPRDVSVSFMVNGQLESYAYGNLKKMWDTVPNVIRSEMSKKLYVDAVNGDDNNIGSPSSKMKTIKKAIESTPENSSLTIYLAGGQTHEITENIQLSARNIEFSGGDVFPKIKSMENGSDTSGRFIVGNFNSNIIFYKCEVCTQDDSGHTSIRYNSMFDVMYGSLDIKVNGGKINLNVGNFIYGYSGLSTLDVSVRSVEVIQGDTTSSKLIYAPFSKTSLVFVSSTLTNTTSADILNVDTSMHLTNI